MKFASAPLTTGNVVLWPIVAYAFVSTHVDMAAWKVQTSLVLAEPAAQLRVVTPHALIVFVAAEVMPDACVWPFTCSVYFHVPRAPAVVQSTST